MNDVKAIIIDDEQHCIDRLMHLLKASQQVELCGTAANLTEGLTLVATVQPQLVFLDVQLGEQTGFQFLQSFKAVNFEVIFTTAYDTYALKAFKFSALDYLLKPIDPLELEEAIGKMQKKLSFEDTRYKLDVLFHNMKLLAPASKKICVPVLNGFVFLKVEDIVRCKSDVNYTTIFLSNNTKLVVAKTLKEFEEMLSDAGFYRIHNSHLVNMNYIKSYNKGKGGFLVMQDNSEVEVSTRRKEDFLKKLASL